MNGYTPTTARIRDGYALSAADPEAARREFEAWFRPFECDRATLARIRALLRDKDDDGEAVLP